MSWKSKPAPVLAGLLRIHVLAHIDRNLLSGFASQITGDLVLNNKQFGFLSGTVWVLSFGFMAILVGSLANRLTTALACTDVLVALSLWFFWSAARSGDAHLGDARDKSVAMH